MPEMTRKFFKRTYIESLLLILALAWVVWTTYQLWMHPR
jgi:hypothetical protein